MQYNNTHKTLSDLMIYNPLSRVKEKSSGYFTKQKMPVPLTNINTVLFIGLKKKKKKKSLI